MFPAIFCPLYLVHDIVTPMLSASALLSIFPLDKMVKCGIKTQAAKLGVELEVELEVELRVELQEGF